MACLRATGMSIEDMRKFRELAKDGFEEGAQQQVELFEAHRRQLELELARKHEHLRYLELKVEFWKAVVAGDEAKAREIAAVSDNLAKHLLR
jgi:DNA-binding transcriptional MerR regulator